MCQDFYVKQIMSIFCGWIQISVCILNHRLCFSFRMVFMFELLKVLALLINIMYNEGMVIANPCVKQTYHLESFQAGFD